MHLLLAYIAPARTFEVMYWYGLMVSGSDTLAALGVTCAQIALCMPIYYAVLRSAPWLIGRAAVQNETVAAHPIIKAIDS